MVSISSSSSVKAYIRNGKILSFISLSNRNFKNQIKYIEKATHDMESVPYESNNLKGIFLYHINDSGISTFKKHISGNLSRILNCITFRANRSIFSSERVVYNGVF